MSQEPSHFPIPSFDPIKYYQLFLIMHQAWVCSLFLLFLKCILAHLSICSFSSSSTEPVARSKTFCNPGVGRVLDMKQIMELDICQRSSCWLLNQMLSFGGFHALVCSLPREQHPSVKPQTLQHSKFKCKRTMQQKSEKLFGLVFFNT